MHDRNTDRDYHQRQDEYMNRDQRSEWQGLQTKTGTDVTGNSREYKIKSNNPGG